MDISDKLSDDPLVNAIPKYENHPSIIKIKLSVETIINLMDSTKKTSGAIPIKIVKLADKKFSRRA